MSLSNALITQVPGYPDRAGAPGPVLSSSQAGLVSFLVA